MTAAPHPPGPAGAPGTTLPAKGKQRVGNSPQVDRFNSPLRKLIPSFAARQMGNNALRCHRSGRELGGSSSAFGQNPPSTHPLIRQCYCHWLHESFTQVSSHTHTSFETFPPLFFSLQRNIQHQKTPRRAVQHNGLLQH